MTEQHLDSDLLLDLAHGRRAGSPEELAHLRKCEACRGEQDLVRAAMALGSTRLPELDSAQIAAQVRARVTEAQPAPVRRIGWPVALALAATVLLAVWLKSSPETSTPDLGPLTPAATVLHELDSLDARQLALVLDAIPDAESVAGPIELLPLGSLNVDDLERVLRSMEEQ